MRKFHLAALVLLLAVTGIPSLPIFAAEPNNGKNQLANRSKADGGNADSVQVSPNKIPSENSGKEETEKEDSSLVHLTDSQRKLIRLRISRAAAGKLETMVSLNGEIRLNRDETARIMPRMPGFVNRIFVKEGDSVRRGERLATLTSHKLGEYYSNYNSALEQENLTKSEFEMAEQLKKGNATSRKDYLRYKREYAEAVIARRHAEELLRSLLLDPAHEGHPHEPGGKDLLPICTTYDILSPLDGTVINRNITLGENFTEDTLPVVFTVSNLNRLWLELRATPEDLLRIRKGDDVRVTGAEAGQEFRGKVVYLGPLIDEQTRTGLVRVEIENRNGQLRPGQFVTGRIQTGASAETVLVPREAVQLIAGESVLFVPRGDGYAPQPVTTGQSARGVIEILSGLKASEDFVSSGAFELKSILLTSGMDPHAGHGH